VDGQRFDELTKRIAAGVPRRRVIKGLAGGAVAGAAALLRRSGADAQRVTQAYCGNYVCKDDPSVCRDGCECCVFGNGNSRCMPPQDCARYGGTSCDESGQCGTGSNTCSGGVVPCDQGLPACGPGADECVCVLTTEGDSFCSSDGRCADCMVDADCENEFGSGVRCVQGGDCCEGGNFCGWPCGTPPPDLP
jgi:hypothetical protein